MAREKGFAVDMEGFEKALRLKKTAPALLLLLIPATG